MAMAAQSFASPAAASVSTKMQATEVTVHYGAKQALQGTTVSVPEHTVVALIGPSGCGKSTFLRCLNRMNDTIENCHVGGKVLLDGQDIYGEGVDPVLVRRRVGMVFQRSNPFPKTIHDNVAYGLRIAGMSNSKEIARRVEQALRDAALWDEVKDRLDESGLGLSGGQQQRLCIARALAVEPEVLLMDEPASALDPIATAKLEDLIGDLRRKLAIVIVTHSMQQARRVSQQTAFFFMGQLVETGDTQQIFEAPKQQKTAEYVTGRFG